MTEMMVWLCLGFALGFLWHKSLVSEHLVSAGERLLGRVADRLGRGESLYASFNVSRYDAGDDDGDGGEDACPVDPHDLKHPEPWRMN